MRWLVVVALASSVGSGCGAQYEPGPSDPSWTRGALPALALADVAHAALQSGDVSRERLLAYEHIRRPINDRSVAISRIAGRAFRAGRYLPLSILIPFAMRTINALGWPKRRILRTFSSTFVT